MRLEKFKPQAFGLRVGGADTDAGFTLVELLAVVMLFTFLSILVVPTLVRAKQKTRQATCRSNLRQLGFALQSYTEANSNFLPGPIAPLAAASYDLSSSNQLIWFVADRVGAPEPSKTANTAPQLLCPARGTDEPGGSFTKRAADYALNDGRALASPPFGRVDAPITPPLKLSTISSSTAPAACFAVADADKGNVNPTLRGWNGLPYSPIHGQVRNQLFFDWHVASKTW